MNNQVYCPGNSINIPFSGTTPGTTFSWTNNNASSGVALMGTGTIVATATNTTTSPIVSTIMVTPSFNGCAEPPISFTITVNPTPTVTLSTN